MREIKFRGKRIDNGEWYYGSIIKNYEGDCFIIKAVDSYVGFFDSCPDDIFIEVDPETVGQLVFSHDGQGYYEGDIVKASHGKCEIRLNEKRSAFMLFDLIDEMYVMNMEPYVYRHAAMYGLQVIGNIHDNMELIK